MPMTFRGLARVAAVGSLCGLVSGCADRGPSVDEARRAGRSVESLAAADEDHFRDMDDGIVLTPEEVRGRNM